MKFFNLLRVPVSRILFYGFISLEQTSLFASSNLPKRIDADDHALLGLAPTRVYQTVCYHTS